MTDKKKMQSGGFSAEKPSSVSRRDLLKGVGALGVGALSGVAAGQSVVHDSASAAVESIPLREALEVLTADEAATLEAICDCLIPSDEHGPGAKEARAVHYIDHSLASHNNANRQDYLIGLSTLNDYSRRTRGKAFYDLVLDVQNSILLALQQNKLEGFSPSSTGFFNLLRGDAIDGTFCDPYYGGNQHFVGWDMLKYPGIRLSASETDVAAGAALPPTHQSAYDHITYTKMESNRLILASARASQRGDENA
ncbi:MAG: gluconate 2-dehydrogenase gamma chain [Pseudohongiellaceae bacterium]|jgi:gluconate 2-dehydrogenase gamma chain